MIFKRTKSLSNPRAAVSWAKDYQDELSKNKKRLQEEKEQGKLEKMGVGGIGWGRTYYTSRPAGLLSAHGFVKQEVAQLQLAYGLDANAAALRYIEIHCLRQRKKRRTIMGLRAIASLDAAVIEPFARDMVDLDHAMVTSVERTMEALAAEHYPEGDSIGLFLGVHHDKLTTSDPNSRRPGKPPPKASRLDKPHLHAHLFIIPHTALGRQLSISNHSFPQGKGMPAVDMLDEARQIFNHQAQLSIAALPGPINEVFLSKEWNALARLAAQVTIQDFRSGPEMKPTSARQFVANRFPYYLRALDKEHIKRRLKERGDRVKEMMKQGKTLEDAEEYGVSTLENLRPGFEERSVQLKQLRDAYRSNIRPPQVVVNLLQRPKAILTTAVDLGRSFADDLKSVFKTLDMRRKGSRITLLSDIAEAELIQASVRGVYPVHGEL